MSETFWSAAKYAMRVLLRTPLFTIPVVLCIALVLAAISTVFGVVDALMFRAVPFEDPDELVILNAVHSMPDMEPEVLTISPKDFVAWREQAESFTGMASVYERNFNLAEAGVDTAGGGADTEPERLEGVLLTTAGLLIRSFQALESVDPGFDSANLLTFRASLPDSRYPGNAERVQFAARAVDRLSGMPGVSSAALTTTLPIGDRAADFSASFSIEGRPPADEGSRRWASSSSPATTTRPSRG